MPITILSINWYVVIGTILTAILIMALPKFFRSSNELAKYGSRKFLIAIALLLATIQLAFMEAIDSMAVAGLLSLVSGGYSIANHTSASPEFDDATSRKFILTTATIAAAVILSNCYLLESIGVLTVLSTAGGTYGFVNVRNQKNTGMLPQGKK